MMLFSVDSVSDMLSCFGVAECYDGNGVDYRGTMSYTDIGTQCMKWSEAGTTVQGAVSVALGNVAIWERGEGWGQDSSFFVKLGAGEISLILSSWSFHFIALKLLYRH
jgi:hypothetical protein